MPIKLFSFCREDVYNRVDRRPNKSCLVLDIGQIPDWYQRKSYCQENIIGSNYRIAYISFHFLHG